MHHYIFNKLKKWRNDFTRNSGLAKKWTDTMFMLVRCNE